MSALSISQTYLLANKAQAKLQREAQKQDLDLRILLSHAHLLDNIIDHLSTVKSSPPQRQPQHYYNSITSFDAEEDSEDDDLDESTYDDMDSDDEFDSYVDYYSNSDSFFNHSSANSSIIYNVAEIVDEDDDDDDEDNEYLLCDEHKAELTGNELSDSESELSDNSDFSSMSCEDEDDHEEHSEENIIYNFTYAPDKSIKHHNKLSKTHSHCADLENIQPDSSLETTSVENDIADLSLQSNNASRSNNYVYTAAKEDLEAVPKSFNISSEPPSLTTTNVPITVSN